MPEVETALAPWWWLWCFLAFFFFLFFFCILPVLRSLPILSHRMSTSPSGLPFRRSLTSSCFFFVSVREYLDDHHPEPKEIEKKRKTLVSSIRAAPFRWFSSKRLQCCDSSSLMSHSSTRSRSQLCVSGFFIF